MDLAYPKCLSVQSFINLSLSFCIQFFKQHVNIIFQRALTFMIERKIALASDVCSRTPTTIRSHDLHAGDIRGAMGEKARKTRSLPILKPLEVACILALFWPPPLCLPFDGSGHHSLIGFLCESKLRLYKTPYDFLHNMGALFCFCLRSYTFKRVLTFFIFLVFLLSSQLFI